MRSLGVCAILLTLAAVAPPPAQRGPFEPLWALGALVLLAVTLQDVLSRLRLPAVVGWILSGLVLGPSLFHVVEPLRVPLLALCFSVAGLWAGLLVGLGVSWPKARRIWRLPLVIATSTLLTIGIVAGGISVATDLPPVTILVLAALASMWGPLMSTFWRGREGQVIGLFGIAFAFIVLSVVLGATALPGGIDWVLRLWVALLLGAVAGESLWRLHVLDRKVSALLSLAALTIVATLVARRFGLPCLPMGLGLGLVLAVRQGSGRQLEHLLAPARSMAILLFAGLLATSAPFGGLLWPVPRGLLEILVVQIVTLVLIRGVAPAVWYPLPPDAEFSRRSGWLLLPRGLIAGELVLGAGAALPGILSAGDGALLRAVVFADVFIFSMFFAAVAAAVPPPAPTPPAVTEKEVDPPGDS